MYPTLRAFTPWLTASKEILVALRFSASEVYGSGDQLRGQVTSAKVRVYHENTKGDNYGYNLDTSKTLSFLGQQQLHRWLPL